jgi:hypothetical protein
VQIHCLRAILKDKDRAVGVQRRAESQKVAISQRGICYPRKSRGTKKDKGIPERVLISLLNAGVCPPYIPEESHQVLAGEKV